MNKKSKYLQVFEMRQQGFSCQEAELGMFTAVRIKKLRKAWYE